MTGAPALGAEAERIAGWLEPEVAARRWLAELDAVPAGPVRLPDDDAAAGLLRRMRLPAADVAEALAARPDPDARPRLWWLLERCRALLVERLGDLDRLASWPDLPERLGAHGRWFYLWVFVAATPDLLAYHAGRGIPEDVSSATLADVGSKVALRRRTRGADGLDKQDWFTLHFRGLLYALGRLQFNVSRVRDGMTGLVAGDPCLDTHIPEAGPLTPEACDASFAAAPEFFARHFGVRHTVVSCTSWLLDEQLTEYLPGTSNILRFQRRFRLGTASYVDDAGIVEFVFRRVGADLAELPQDTTLRRALVAHLRAGRHWRVRGGWFGV